MTFDNDVFISYAHKDNRPLDGQQWVTNLEHALDLRLNQLRRDKIRIWRDPKLAGNDVFAETLVQELERVAVLVSVISPNYVESEWCLRELRTFFDASEKSGGLQIGERLRVFKVQKTPVDRRKLPQQLQSVTGFDFFFEDERGRIREMYDVFGEEAKREFWANVFDLAEAIHDMLERLEARLRGEQPAAAADAHAVSGDGANGNGSKPGIFLAHVSADRREEHASIRRELQRHGYPVLPEHHLPTIASELAGVVGQQLEGCSMSVHLIGDSYGMVPEGASESIIVLQSELAAQRAGEDGFQQLIRIPPGLEGTDERQREFLAQLREGAFLRPGMDVVETPLEDFKTLLHQRLEPEPTRASNGGPAPTGDGVKAVYLVCDQRDLEATDPLADWLYEQRGYDVILPEFEGDEGEVRKYHEDSLRHCDAILLHYGSGNGLWLQRKLREIDRCARLGRDTEPVVGIYVAPPTTPQKARLRTRQALVMHGADTFDPEHLAPYVEHIERSAPGPDA